MVRAVGVDNSVEGEEVPERGRDEPARSRDRIGASGAAPAVRMLCWGCWSGLGGRGSP